MEYLRLQFSSDESYIEFGDPTLIFHKRNLNLRKTPTANSFGLDRLNLNTW